MLVTNSFFSDNLLLFLYSKSRVCEWDKYSVDFVYIIEIQFFFQLKIYCYNYHVFYIGLLVTIKKIPKEDTQNQMKKEAKLASTKTEQTTKEEKKEEKKETNIYKTEGK